MKYIKLFTRNVKCCMSFFLICIVGDWIILIWGCWGVKVGKTLHLCRALAILQLKCIFIRSKGLLRELTWKRLPQTPLAAKQDFGNCCGNFLILSTKKAPRVKLHFMKWPLWSLFFNSVTTGPNLCTGKRLFIMFPFPLGKVTGISRFYSCFDTL